ncbi:hypothetical protein HK103_000190 [Boothiomyces macroporosus]|uniref:Bromodomain-containing protein n=1 Tax=Boothiomyces macroporosus TaxID=261099 RepID=A0AAD5Y7C5_9FUNG|nr:hypothetical protein HK103_000190 [Boothiomyces macroporosus]
MTVELKQEQAPEISKKEPVFQQEVKEEEISQTVDQQEQPEQDPLLIKEQLKWIGTMIKNMKRRKGSHIFHNPVDPVALNIPTYFDVIKNPMDISTIEKKLSTYNSAKECFDDFELMFNNCYTFNGQSSAVGIMSMELQKWFEKEWEKLPKSLEQVEAKKKRKSDIGLGLREVPTDTRPRREAAHEDGKKRLLSKKSLLDMKFCNHIHREVTRKQYNHFVWPFLTPVDPEAMGIPQYRTIVTHPMDLSTIKKKLDSSEYLSAEDYEEDFRLMLNNCFAFNAVGTEVYNYGKQLESLFNLKWAEKTTFLLQHGESKVRKMSGLDETSDEDDDGAFDLTLDEDARHIQMLKSQLVLLNQQLQMLTEKRAKKKKRKSISGPAGVGSGVAAPGLASVKKKSKSKSGDKKSNKKKRPHNDTDDEKMPETDITYEQKRELSDNINILPPEKLPQVFEIIKENTQLQAAEDEEIELDIDSLDKAVLWKLYLFVKKHTRPPKKAKYDDENGTATGADVYHSEGSPKPSTKAPKKINSVVKGKKPAEPKKPTAPAPIAKKKTASPLPFRTEIGEYTTNTTTYVSKNPVPKTAPHPPMRKPTAPVPAKPKYDSVLDSAWERHESISQSEPVVDPEPEPIIEANPLSEHEHPPVLEEYIEPTEWLDLQGVSDMMQDFSNEFPEISPTVYQQREAYLEKTIQKVKEMSAEDWSLNIDEGRNESDEEGAYASD